MAEMLPTCLHIRHRSATPAILFRHFHHSSADAAPIGVYHGGTKPSPDEDSRLFCNVLPWSSATSATSATLFRLFYKKSGTYVTIGVLMGKATAGRMRRKLWLDSVSRN